MLNTCLMISEYEYTTLRRTAMWDLLNLQSNKQPVVEKHWRRDDFQACSERMREWMMGVVTDRNKTVTWHVCWIRWFRQRLWETGTTMLYWNSGLILQIWWYLLKETARNTKWGRCRHSVNRNVPLQVQNEHARNSFPRTPRLSTAAGATASTYKCMTITFRNITHSHGGVRVL